MSYEDELRDYMEKEGLLGVDPEEVFRVVTIMPERRLKVTAHLEDEEGNQILVKDIAVETLDYIDKHLKTKELTPLNSQIFPLMSQFMMSVVPRASDLLVADFIFSAPAIRRSFIFLSMGSFLLNQYIHQHKLKIITEEEEISEEQLQEWLDKSHKAEQKLRKAILGADADEEFTE